MNRESKQEITYRLIDEGKITTNEARALMDLAPLDDSDADELMILKEKELSTTFSRWETLREIISWVLIGTNLGLLIAICLRVFQT